MEDARKELSDSFAEAAMEIDGIQQLVSPGFAGLTILFSHSIDGVSTVLIEGILKEKEWAEEKSFTFSELEALLTEMVAADESVKSLREENASTEDKSSSALQSSNAALPLNTQKATVGVMDRIEMGIFPSVLPHESKLANGIAEETLAFVHESDHTELQFFIDASREDYFRDLPPGDDRPLSVRQAEWAREFYYLHIRRFYMSKAMRDGEFKHRKQGSGFLSMCPPSSIDTETSRAEAFDLEKKIHHEDVSAFDLLLSSRSSCLWGTET
jgi:hypothetical protein